MRSNVNLFVEGPTPDWALPIPEPVEHSPPGVKRFSFELDGLPPGAKPDGAALKFTLVGAGEVVRVQYEFELSRSAAASHRVIRDTRTMRTGIRAFRRNVSLELWIPGALRSRTTPG